MPNETLIAVPTDVTEAGTLQWFLNRLVEELDIVLGLRGDSSYVTTTEVASVQFTLTSVAEEIIRIDAEAATLATELTANSVLIAENTTLIEDNATLIDANSALIAALHDSTVLDSTYHNFDNAAYATLVGRSEFNTLGSNITNAPYTPVGGETYYNYFNNIVTDNGGVVQELKAFSTTTLAPTAYFRIGDTWIEAQALGWT